MALEVLFAWGDLMVADRVNFQRVYDRQGAGAAGVGRYHAGRSR
jgi:hypothetical protein